MTKVRPTMIRRSWLVYGSLLVAWITILSWQLAEHSRVRRSARQALINRATDISSTMGLVMRSQRRFGGVISRERLEGALKDLIKPGEMNAVALLNAAGEVVASAGAPIDLEHKSMALNEAVWSDQNVILMNLVDLGTNIAQSASGPSTTIVLPRREMFGGETNRFAMTNPPPREPPEMRDFADGPPRPARGTNEARPWPPRPWRLSKDEYKTMAEKAGVHSFVLAMSTDSLHAIVRQDAWLRSLIGVLTTLSVLGAAFAWRNVCQTSALQLRLIRASELNTHLKEMNLAAAGLAHETRNPLNIIRGLAQMVSKEDQAKDETRQKALEIINEADRVAAQLNEFINYSRPREVRAAAVPLDGLVNDVAKALNYDLEEKQVQLVLNLEPLVVEADEQLLRQAFFNLLINSIQAVEPRGQITVRTGLRQAAEAFLEVADNGPGVPLSQRSDIFKPYFTTHQRGTGLGLAVVQQIVLAHGWDIEYVPNEPKGALFRVTHLKLAGRK